MFEHVVIIDWENPLAAYMVAMLAFAVGRFFRFGFQSWYEIRSMRMELREAGLIHGDCNRESDVRSRYGSSVVGEPVGKATILKG